MMYESMIYDKKNKLYIYKVTETTRNVIVYGRGKTEKLAKLDFDKNCIDLEF